MLLDFILKKSFLKTIVKSKYIVCRSNFVSNIDKSLKKFKFFTKLSYLFYSCLLFILLSKNKLKFCFLIADVF